MRKRLQLGPGDQVVFVENEQGDLVVGRSNAEVDFQISEADMDALRGLKAQDYGEHSAFPVYSGK